MDDLEQLENFDFPHEKPEHPSGFFIFIETCLSEKAFSSLRGELINNGELINTDDRLDLFIETLNNSFAIHLSRLIYVYGF